MLMHSLHSRQLTCHQAWTRSEAEKMLVDGAKAHSEAEIVKVAQSVSPAQYCAQGNNNLKRNNFALSNPLLFIPNRHCCLSVNIPDPGRQKAGDKK